MKRILRTGLILCAAFAVACAPRERTIVVLSTNDMHAKIQQFPRLATAVAACRDTAQVVVLVDAGDRWTGNAYVDRTATPGMPIINLMNRLGYRVATLGNHEFDHGQAFLGRVLDSMDFEVVCANVLTDTCSFPELPPYTIVEEQGIRIGFIGVVTNYEGPGHPAGNEDSFAGLEFPDPQQMARKYAAELRPQCDVVILLSHMGDDRDAELLSGGDTQLDEVIGGHTHELRDTLVGGVLLTQTGKDLKNVGVTTIRMRGKQIDQLDFRLVSLDDYQPDAAYQAEVDRYYANPELNRPVGEFARTADKWGLANWMSEAIRDEADAQIGIYHVGGVRLDSIAAGGVSKAKIYGLEPFGTQIATMRMTPSLLRQMIVTKYNEPTKEGHRIDLIATTPYVIVTDAADRAVDVRFPELQERKSYKIAISDYVFKNYKDLHYTDGRITDEPVVDQLLEILEEHTPFTSDNSPRQQVDVRR